MSKMCFRTRYQTSLIKPMKCHNQHTFKIPEGNDTDPNKQKLMSCNICEYKTQYKEYLILHKESFHINYKTFV